MKRPGDMAMPVSPVRSGTMLMTAVSSGTRVPALDDDIQRAVSERAAAVGRPLTATDHHEQDDTQGELTLGQLGVDQTSDVSTSSPYEQVRSQSLTGLSVRTHMVGTIAMSVPPSVCPSVCLSVPLSVCVFVANIDA